MALPNRIDTYTWYLGDTINLLIACTIFPILLILYFTLLFYVSTKYLKPFLDRHGITPLLWSSEPTLPEWCPQDSKVGTDAISIASNTFPATPKQPIPSVTASYLGCNDEEAIHIPNEWMDEATYIPPQDIVKEPEWSLLTS